MLYLLHIFLTLSLTAAAAGLVYYRRKSRRCESAARNESGTASLVLRSAGESYWVCTKDWSAAEYISPLSADIWGIPDNDLSSRPLCWLDLVHPADLPQVREAVLSSRVPPDGRELPDFRISGKSGEQIWISLTIRPVDGDGGRILAVSKNVTGRATDCAIMGKAFFENPCSMMVSDLDTHLYCEVNRAFLRARGISREDIVGQSVFKFKDWLADESFERITAAVREGDSVISLPITLNAADGTPKSGLFFAEKIIVPQRRMLISTIIDVTEQRKTTEQLKKSRKRLDDFAVNIPGVVFQLYRRKSGERGFYYVSGKSADVFGLQVDPIEDYTLRFMSCLPDDVRERLLGSVNDAFTAGGSWQFEGPFRKPDGSVIWFQGTAGVTVISDEESIATGFLLDISSRKRVEEALKISELKFRTLFESMTEGMSLNELIVDTSGNAADYRVLSANPAYLRFTGLKLKEIQGRTATEIFGTDRPPYLDEYAAVVKSGSSVRTEKHFPLLEKYFAMTIVCPSYGQFAVILEDITESKKAEELLRERESRYRSLYEKNPLPMLIYEKKTFRLLSVNDVFLSIYGYSHEEALRLVLTDLYPENERDLITQFAARLHGYANAGEWHHLRKDGAVMTIVAHSHDISYEGRSARIAVITDITERKLAEDEIHRLKNFLSDIVDSYPAILLGVDSDMKVNFMNREGLKYSSRPGESAVGRNLSDVLERFAPVMGRLRDDIAARRQSTYPKFLADMGEEKRFFDISTYPLSGQSGTVIRIDDVTESVHREDQLRQAQKMETVGTLAGGLAHDFNNVLGGIIGTVGLVRYTLEKKGELEGKIAGYMDLIDKAGTRAADMVKQLLMLSRKQEMSRVALDLNIAVHNVMQICANSFDKSIALKTEYHYSSAMVEGDPTQVEQVFLNICVNASHAMTIMRSAGDKQGGSLTVAVLRVDADRAFCMSHPGSAECPYWMVSFADTGIGMDEKTLAKVFDPFFTMKGKQHGTGLGLAMAYNIVHQHNGFIDVYSEPGVGTTFNVFLPCKDEVFAASGTDEQHDIVKGKGTILVVDDEEIVRSIASSILFECGYDVLTAEDGATGLALFRSMKEAIDLVLLDMAMPGLSGREVFIEMKNIRPKVKVLLSSGFRQDSRVEETISLGVKGFIQKPYSMSELSKKVDEIIRS